MGTFREEDKLLRIWDTIRRVAVVGAVIGFILFIVIVLPSLEGERTDRNGVNRRNNTRDTIECESKGGLMGQDICFDVDSIIPLVGAREEHKTP